jgi:hypothetical protein
MKKVLITILAVGGLGVAGGFAMQAQAMPPHNDGPGLGHHVSQMAPDHPRAHGQMFGDCVSTMARGGHQHSAGHESCDMNSDMTGDMAGHMSAGAHMNGGIGGHMGN